MIYRQGRPPTFGVTRTVRRKTMRYTSGVPAKRLLPTLAALLILLTFAGVYYQETIAVQAPGLIDIPSDFKAYYQAAQYIVHGKSPFIADGYIYPPLLAFLLTPLTPLDYVTARRTWFGISQGFMVAGAVLLWLAAGRDWTAACWIAFVWASGGSADESLGLGQVGPLLMLLVVLAMTRDRAVRGAAVAVAFAIKLFPGLVGIAVFLRGERRAMAWMLVGAIAALLLPWAAVAKFLDGPAGFTRHSAWMGTPATLSWSVPSVVLRIMDPPQRPYPLPRNWEAGTDLEHFELPLKTRAIALGTAVLVLAVGLAILVRRVGYPSSASQSPWIVAALVSLALAASPVSWTHYQVLQYPGVALLLMALWRQRRWAQLANALVLASLLYPVPVAILGAYYLKYHEWTAYSPATLYVWTSVTPFAALALFGMFLRELTKR